MGKIPRIPRYLEVRLKAIETRPKSYSTSVHATTPMSIGTQWVITLIMKRLLCRENGIESAGNVCCVGKTAPIPPRVITSLL